MSTTERRISLDQFRGYTVLGMLAVNFLQSFQFISEQAPFLQHYQTYFSYADSIMPQFFFAVGYAYRLTFLRRLESFGWESAFLKTIWRNAGLILLGLVVYRLDGNFGTWQEVSALGCVGFFKTAFQREPFQTLVHIGLTALWVMPVIALRWPARLIYAGCSLLLFLILSQNFYYVWAMQRPVIDGGPLGFLSWSVPMLAGAWSHDAVEENKGLNVLLIGASGLLILGYGLSLLPGGGGIWAMSQRAGSVSYQIFGAGFSMLAYAFFYWLCDLKKIQSDFLRTFGTNALAAYLLDGWVSGLLSPWAPADSPWPYMALMLTMHVGICYLFLRGMEKQRFFLRF